MGYDLRAVNPKDQEQSEFHMGAFSFPVILDITSGLFPAAFGKGQWYMPANVGEVDGRFNGNYPGPLSNDNFEVTEEEAKIMARFSRNWARIQRDLPEENRTSSLFEGNKGKDGIKREDMMALLMAASRGQVPGEPWPAKVRDDFVVKIEEFADWAEQSGGFTIG